MEAMNAAQERAAQAAADAYERAIQPAVEAMRRKSFGINPDDGIRLAVEALVTAGFTIIDPDGNTVTPA
jgi:hypothetical protein